MRTFDRESLAWLAGFTDGEGTFHAQKRGGYPTYTLPQSGDDGVPDVLLRAQAILGIGRLSSGTSAPPRKRRHRLNVSGFERTQFVAALLWPWLGTEKRQQAAAVLRTARSRPRGKARAEGIAYAKRTHCPAGHPYDTANTRYYRGKRRCRECTRAEHEVRRRAAGIQPKNRPVEERFYSNVVLAGECWLWVGPIDARGRSTFRKSSSQRAVTPRQASWFIQFGEESTARLLPDCTTPGCIRHLQPGSPKGGRTGFPNSAKDTRSVFAAV